MMLDVVEWIIRMISTNSWCILMFFLLLPTFDPSCWQRLEWSYWYRDRRRHHHISSSTTTNIWRTCGCLSHICAHPHSYHHLHQASNEHGLHGGWSRLVLIEATVVSTSAASPGWLGQRCWATQKTEGEEGLEVAREDQRLEDWCNMILAAC